MDVLIEMATGLLVAGLGWVCMDYAMSWRRKRLPVAGAAARGASGEESRSRMLVPLVLGALLLISGGGIILLAIFSLIR
jgi:hypothetical protein